jgi:hypothetical protein
MPSKPSLDGPEGRQANLFLSSSIPPEKASSRCD